MKKELVPKMVPDGWIMSTLGEVGIVTSGGTPSTKNPSLWGGDIPWITPADLSNYNDKYIAQGSRSLSKNGLEHSSAKLLPKGSILYSSRAPIGYVAIASASLATNQGFKNIIPTKSLFSDYIYYYLKSIKSLAENLASGTTFLELSATKFSQIPIPVPPLKEQHRIVAKIEEIFSEIDNSLSGLTKAKRQLKVYEKALLKSAFDGKIKKDTDGKVSTWQTKTLGEVYNFVGGGTPTKNNPSFWNGDINWASVKDIKEMYLTNTQDHITQEGLANSATHLANENDVILVTRISPGKVSIARKKIAINQDLKIIRPFLKNIEPKFTFYLFQYLNSAIQLLSSGTTVSGITLKSLNSIKISYPDQIAQKAIVQNLESQNSIINNLLKAINQAERDLELFRHSILKKAFAGTLVIQQFSEQNATELLKQISAEKVKYLLEMKTEKDMKPKTKIKKTTLIDNLRDRFKNKEFSFEDVKDGIYMPYEEFKTEFFSLLDQGAYLKSQFDKKNERVIYKLIK